MDVVEVAALLAAIVAGLTLLGLVWKGASKLIRIVDAVTRHLPDKMDGLRTKIEEDHIAVREDVAVLGSAVVEIDTKLTQHIADVGDNHGTNNQTN